MALTGSFHGRTAGALAMTGQAKYREPFGELVPGVRFVPLGDIARLEEACGPSTAAIFLEPVQGESGVHEASPEFLRAARRLADRYDALLVADEVQCGLGRTGERFAYQRFEGVTPDLVTVAKPLAAGLPLAATLFNQRAAAAVRPGWHGTTFGGGPLACRVALEVLALIEEQLPRVRRMGDYLGHRLREAFCGHGEVREVRRVGLMAALELRSDAAAAVDGARERGLLVNATAGNTIRMLPPYVATEAEVDTAVATLAEVLVSSATPVPA